MFNPATRSAPSSVRPGGLVLTADLIREGHSDEEARWVTRGLYRLRHGAYALREPANEEARHALFTRAVVLRHRNFVAASHVSAAVMLGLPLWGVSLTTTHVTGVEPVRRGIRHRVHTHEGPLAPSELVDVDDIKVTCAGRTVIDCARMLPLDRAVAIADHALHHGLTDEADLRARLDDLGQVKGIQRVRRVVQLADGRSESPGESRTRLVVGAAGIPVDPQVEVRDSRGRFIARVDLKVRGLRVVIEFDGRAKYLLDGDAEQAHWAEKRRHDALNNAGFLVVRVTWNDLARPAEVVARVREAIARARQFGLEG